MTSHLSEWLSSKRQQITNVQEDIKKRDHWYTVDRNINCLQPLSKIIWRLHKKLKIELPYDPSIPAQSKYLKKRNTNSKKTLRTPMFIRALFTTAMIWRQTKCPSMNEWNLQNRKSLTNMQNKALVITGERDGVAD